VQLFKINIIFEIANLIFRIYFYSIPDMNCLQLKFRNSTIGYSHFGSGPKIAVCFHGYGEDSTTFGFLSEYAGNQYTFYSIDLPFHGKTDWKEGLNFSGADLFEIVQSLLKTSNQNAVLKEKKITLIGFSLGGRAALSLFGKNPDIIEKMVLMAPDGLKINFWYWLSTQTWIGNKFFAFTMEKPGWFLGLLKLLNKLKLVNASIFKFVNYYIGDKDVRLLLYQRWTTLRNLKPDLKNIKSIIRKENTPVRLIYGKYDRIILSSIGEKFKSGIEKQCTISIIHSGHQVLHEKHVQEILPALLQ
jgi:pimeloyl-ACP methyl ester carboxylesterase